MSRPCPTVPRPCPTCPGTVATTTRRVPSTVPNIVPFRARWARRARSKSAGLLNNKKEATVPADRAHVSAPNSYNPAPVLVGR